MHFPVLRCGFATRRLASVLSGILVFGIACTNAVTNERSMALAPADSPQFDDSVTTEILARTNEARREAHLAPLLPSATLASAAQLQAEQMARASTMAHVLPDAPCPTLISRLNLVSYPLRTAGENVAAGFDSGTEAFEGWMHSATHRANILDASYTEMGAGVAVGTDGRAYYAQVFGTPRQSVRTVASRR